MEILPIELKEDIISYLSLVDLYNLRKVNTHWMKKLRESYINYLNDNIAQLKDKKDRMFKGLNSLNTLPRDILHLVDRLKDEYTDSWDIISTPILKYETHNIYAAGPYILVKYFTNDIVDVILDSDPNMVIRTLEESNIKESRDLYKSRHQPIISLEYLLIASDLRDLRDKRRLDKSMLERVILGNDDIETWNYIGEDFINVDIGTIFNLGAYQILNSLTHEKKSQLSGYIGSDQILLMDVIDKIQNNLVVYGIFSDNDFELSNDLVSIISGHINTYVRDMQSPITYYVDLDILPRNRRDDYAHYDGDLEDNPGETINTIDFMEFILKNNKFMDG